ncbi:MAG: YicC/YloC family endoribonuclease [Thermodesulfobacteriota bacterium]
MIQSMTGFGRVESLTAGKSTVVEVRSVNNRFRDVAVRLPRAYAALEEEVKKVVAGRISRGRIDIWIQVDESLNRRQSLKLDLDLAGAYQGLLIELKKALGLNGEPGLEHFLNLKDIFRHEDEGPDLEAFWTGLKPLIEEALEKLIRMRSNEGASLAADFRDRLAIMADWTEEVWSRRETAAIEFKNRLETRIKALTGGMDLDQGRLLQEVAYLVDRSDITEEIVRLRSHFDQFNGLIGAEGPVGRRLEFLLQEMGREVNTIGSKSSDVAVTNRVLDLKTELEKLREQVQNVE